ncbi:hypothetical protein [Serratia proteamaculans]|uniref:hypothetical protein n=1 Tax=Serratia proteamaculans TaxID=28151 RepID=UPI0021BA902C|nr:hypothetical protein [Serratia proteamaculans]
MEFEPTEIISALNKRVTTIRRTTLVLIYIIFSIAVLMLILGYSSNQKELSKTIDSILDLRLQTSDEKQKEFNIALSPLQDKESVTPPKIPGLSQRRLLATNNDADRKPNNETAAEAEESAKMSYFAAMSAAKADAVAAIAAITREKSTIPYSYASAIGSLILKFTLGLFVLYIMRTVFVFIKYYMQLGSDYENQRLAYLLSKGDDKSFRENLEALRGNRIQMERMPSIPQEKLISEIVNAIKKETPSK